MKGKNGASKELAVPLSGVPDLARLKPEERELFLQAFRAGIGAAAAMSPEAQGANVKEFMGTSPTDLRREFSRLPKPAQGGGWRRRPNGHNAH